MGAYLKLDTNWSIYGIACGFAQVLLLQSKTTKSGGCKDMKMALHREIELFESDYIRQQHIFINLLERKLHIFVQPLFSVVL